MTIQKINDHLWATSNIYFDNECCFCGRRLTDKEYKEMLFREQVKEEERVSKMMELLTLKLESDKGER